MLEHENWHRSTCFPEEKRHPCAILIRASIRLGRRLGLGFGDGRAFLGVEGAQAVVTLRFPVDDFPGDEDPRTGVLGDSQFVVGHGMFAKISAAVV